MKTIIILLLPILFTIRLYSQNTCCNKSNSTEAFALLSHDRKFVSSHLEPMSFVLQNQIGKMISFKSPDGKDAYGYEIKSETPGNNYVYVFHELWGVNDYIKQESEKIFKTLGNVNVIAIDLYDRKVATSRDSAAKYMQQVKTDRAEAIIKGAIAYVGKSADIATIGWCFGGGWSMQATLLAGKQCKACVIYYGSPEENIEKLKGLNAPILFVWAERDKWINKEMVSKFEMNMKAAKKSLQIKKYDADHAFANPSNPKFNQEFADDAFITAIHFIRSNLK